MDSKFLIFSHVGNCDPILKSCSAREDLICISRWSILAHTEIYWKLTVGKGPNSIQAEERKKKKRGVFSLPQQSVFLVVSYFLWAMDVTERYHLRAESQ